MKKKILIPLILMTVFVIEVKAQKSNMVFPKTRIGLTPTALASTHPAVQLSLDKKISDLWNFSIESAFIFSSDENAKGFRLRPGIETFVARSSWVSLSLGAHLNWRHSIEYNNLDRISREGDFLRWEYNVRTTESRIGLNLSESLLFKLSERIYAEAGSGLGFMTVFVLRPLDNNDDSNVFLENNLRNMVFLTPYLYINLNFSYTLGK